MPGSPGLSFFESLPVLPGFDDTFNEKNFRDLPDDWVLALTDVRNSTSKIESGKYKEVNAMGAVAIMAMVNLTGKFNFPFIFGGDGATIALPSDLKIQVASALKSIRFMAKESFDLDLRCVIIPMSEIRSRGQNVRIARYGVSDFYSQAAFDGGGVKLAESLMKDDTLSEPFDVDHITSESDANVEGLECRWDEVSNDRGEVHSLLIEVIESDPGKRMSLLREIFQKIKAIYGDVDQSKPITIDKLRLTLSNQKLSVENRVQNGHLPKWEYIKYWIKLRIQWLFGIILMGFGMKSKYVDWSLYKPDLVDNSDHRKLDDMLRLVLAGTEIQRYTMQGYLEELYMQNKIVYGLHHAQSALITCVILNHHREHIHLVDGNDGGYAMAAQNLKLRKSRIETN
ncbi:MAG TPA: hypothetical protein DCE78_01595 [Bacteroidetes bacterium]|nr:hypothetical protein [Bacteroidota bacterium]